ncbi:MULTISPECIES: type IV toxin-antitoxin system AbiEi family antitoxin domain-containing protein [unclassified Caballeronia]|uniref:type IV toxin-antitoxin system AbiEi family antitoxin domain-containing protein n=1 Tax=unclassified Caballeronia TaxID=2646786 RepID=UPI00253FEE92|nr:MULTISPECIES: type IV toxin-antitoxin system AbiEi family antitoxin domain-containing protein [unclassified Caballeronia]
MKSGSRLCLVGTASVADVVQHLLRATPKGRPMDAAALRTFGLSIKTANQLVDDGWMVRLSKGAYLMTGDAATRDGVISFLGRRIHGLHVGGQTALAWYGVRHYIAYRERVVLWGTRRYVIPGWVSDTMLYSYQTTRLFDADMDYMFQLKPIPNGDPSVLVSTPERALLELVSEIGKGLTYEHAANLTGGLRNMRLDVLKLLLSHCRQIKTIDLVRRLSQGTGYAWASELPELARHLIAMRRSISSDS